MKKRTRYLDIILVDRPLVFLCGPALGNEDVDRRILLQKYILKQGSPSKIYLMPVIVDKFFADDFSKNNGKTVSIKEEILAAVAFRTYIFLDSMSTSYEYGLFSNHSSTDDVRVFLDEQYSERANCPIKAFLEHSIHNKTTYRAEYDSNGYIFFRGTEESLHDKSKIAKPNIPPEIASAIESDIDDGVQKSKTKLCFSESDDGNYQFGSAVFSIHDNEISFTISVKTLFYLILFSLTRVGEKTHEYEQIDKLIKTVLFKTFFVKVDKPQLQSRWFFQNPEINIIVPNFSYKTVLECSIEIIEKIEKENQNGVAGSEKNLPFKLAKADSFVVQYETKEVVLDSCVFGNKVKEMTAVRRAFLSNSGSFVRTLFLRTRGKTRKIITYKNTKNGKLLRLYHTMVFDFLSSAYSPPRSIFAYVPKRNSLMCVDCHSHSSVFLKLDIKHFFESIKQTRCISEITSTFFQKKLFISFSGTFHCQIVQIAKRSEIYELLRPCFCRRSLPIGFVTSPIVSNMYLSRFDTFLSDMILYYAKQSKQIVYSRYADDILISGDSQEDIHSISKDIVSHLLELNLKLNDEKTIERTLSHDNDSLKFLGIVIIRRSKSHNVFQIPKSYIKKVSLELANAVKNEDFDQQQKDIAKALYIKSISPISFIKLEKMYKIKTKRDLNQDLFF